MYMFVNKLSIHKVRLVNSKYTMMYLYPPTTLLTTHIVMNLKVKKSMEWPLLEHHVCTFYPNQAMENEKAFHTNKL